MTSQSIVAARIDTVALKLAPINPDWVLEGSPVARAGEIARSTDGTTLSAVWDCTAGSFWWTFHSEETVVILEGAVRVTTQNGACRLLKAGDIAYFAKDSKALGSRWSKSMT